MTTVSSRPSTLLNDHETRVDLLNNEAIASTIVAILRERPDRPITIGVHGDWGAGKSSVLEMIEYALGDEKEVLCLKFNGWRFQGFEDAKIALIEGIVSGLIEKRPALNKASAAVKDLFHRIDWLKVAKRSGGLAFTAVTGLPSLEQVGSIVTTLKGMMSDPAALATKDNLSTVIDNVNDVIKPAETKNVPEEVEEFRKAFDKLLAAADISQLVVLVDDLDRCLPDTAIDTLEAIRLFVFTSRTAFVVAADEAMIEYAVRKHFPDLPETTGPRDYARNYLEKLIQVPFRIPPLGEMETRIYVTLLLAGVDLGEDDKAFEELIKLARERLKRPWKSAALDAGAVRHALPGAADKVNSALNLSEQIGPILASGTKGNPRQIKRFLNSLLLRLKTAEARGFGDEIKKPVLAKLMLAERFIPSLFDQIATTAVSDPQGRCADLMRLEARVASSEKDGGSDKDDEGGDSAVLAEWMSYEPVLAWAKVEPPVGGVDLRPYLFAAKDKKDYFGPASVLGNLVSVVEKLMGTRMAVQMMEGELKQLAKAEAEKIFEALKGRVIGADSLTTRPAGVDGLVALVKAHPFLQGKLLDFLASLPSDKCGAWVVGGWSGAFSDADVVVRFEKQVDAWSKLVGNRALSAAARANLGVKKGK